MDNEHVIRLSGPFRINDSLGRTWNASAIRIVDESYGIIDIYVDLDTSVEDELLHEDPVVIRAILSRLRVLGYDGPDFGPAESGMQDDKLIVLEAPEEFGRFAESKGWKNLAAAYAEEEDGAESDDTALEDVHARAAFDALMQRLGGK